MRITLQESFLYFSQFLTNFSYTITISYFPSIAEEKGLSQSILAIFFALDPLIGLPTSLLIGKYMCLLGRKQVFVFGLISAGSGFMLLGLVQHSSYLVSLILSLLSKVALGVGLGCYMTSGPAILLNLSPNNAEQVIAFLEAVGGIGFLLGPIIGYKLNETSLGCFFFTGGLFFLYAAFSYTLISIEQSTETAKERSSYIGILKERVKAK